MLGVPQSFRGGVAIKENRRLEKDETAFFQGLLELQYGRNVEKKLRSLAGKIPWARGWPDNKHAFWNAEAFMWQRKIGREKRKMIAKELSFLKTGKNLDLGCGAYSYVPGTVGVDISPEMLKRNELVQKKIVSDLEQPLLFSSGEFNSVTAVFVLNYIKEVEKLLREIQRVLAAPGCLLAVLSARPINDWPRQKEVNSFSEEEWKQLFQAAGFFVKLKPKNGLLFYHCVKIRSWRAGSHLEHTGKLYTFRAERLCLSGTGIPPRGMPPVIKGKRKLYKSSLLGDKI